jgi:hypothetical protein
VAGGIAADGITTLVAYPALLAVGIALTALTCT